jgi:nitroreductase
MSEVMDSIKDLRTIHGDFSEREIPDEQMRTILDCAVRAANASARQSYSIVVVSDREKMKNVCGYAGSRLLVFCVDFARITDLAAHLGHEFAVDDIRGFITGSVDTALAAQTACIAAKCLGVDSLFTNGIHRRGVSKVCDALGLPEKFCFPLIALVLGYPNKDPSQQKGRLSGLGVVHFERYHRLTEDELSALAIRYDDPASHLGLTDSWRREGMKHYLDWFYTKWSGKGDTKPFYEALCQAGFLKKGDDD